MWGGEDHWMTSSSWWAYMNLNRYLDILELDCWGFYRQTRVIKKLSVVSKEANATSSRVAEMGGPWKPETPIGLPNFEVVAHDPIELKEWKREARYNNQYGIEFDWLICCLFISFFGRNWRYEQELAGLLWRVEYSEVEFRSVCPGGSRVSCPGKRGPMIMKPEIYSNEWGVLQHFNGNKCDAHRSFQHWIARKWGIKMQWW